MYWEDRYVKGCCWQLLLLPRWLVPNDRPAEKGAFDNAATTIHRNPRSLRSIYIPLFFFFLLHCCRHWSRVKASRAVLQARMWNALCFFLRATNCCLKNSTSSTFWHIQITQSDARTNTQISLPFSSLFAAAAATAAPPPPPHASDKYSGRSGWRGLCSSTGLTCCIGLLE